MSLLDEITDFEQRARARMNELEPLVAEFHELEQFLARLAGGRPEAPATRTMALRVPERRALAPQAKQPTRMDPHGPAREVVAMWPSREPASVSWSSW
jgi:hypothetical protein